MKRILTKWGIFMIKNCPDCILEQSCINITVKNGKCTSYRPNENTQRSIKQNNTYWKVIELWHEHRKIKPDGSIDYDFNTKEKCHIQVRWAVKYINRESATHLIDKRGNSFLHFELDSISFSTPHKKANQYYNDALLYIAEDMKTTVEELTNMAKENMR